MLYSSSITLLVLQVITFTSSLEPCDDVNTAVCHMIAAKDPSLCSNSCLRSLCKRFCGTCPVPVKVDCFHCNDISDPNTCNTTMTCANLNETCIVSGYTDIMSNTHYTLGCAPKQVCVDHFYYNETTGKTTLQSPDDQVIGACCGNDLCNNQSPRDLIDNTSIPATTESPSGMPRSLYARSESECSDMGTDICNALSKTVPNMCDHACIIAVVCPRTCQRCLSCHSCEHTSRPTGCNQTRICEEGQLCYSLKTISLMLEHGYRLGCMDKYICDRFHKEAPLAFGRRGRQSLELSLNGGCCTTDLCNNRDLHGDMTSLPTPTSSVSTVMTTPPDLGTTTTARLCPDSHQNCSSDFTQHGTDCYHITTQTMDWELAKGYCHDKCAELVQFSTVNIAFQVLKELYFRGGLEEKYFIDAKYNISADSWKWISTGEAIPSSFLLQPVNITSTTCGAVGIRRNYHGLSIYFSSQACLSKLPPICQISLS
ncbi:uncharacterized protein [Argopecten irradians]|uniref:uncharacterized protein n=1 Tax=Argopecten irradians TaxID=31199 RepID=UPI00371EBDA0